MYTEILRDIDGVSIFPIVSLVLFLFVFTLMLIRVARLDRRALDKMAQLPLDGHEGGEPPARFTSSESPR